MDFSQAQRLVTGTYILTDAEKNLLLRRYQLGDANARSIIERYGKTQDPHLFYEDLNKNGYLQIKNSTPKRGELYETPNKAVFSNKPKF